MDLDGKEIYRMRIRNNYATKDSGLTDDMTLAAASANAGENMRKRKLEKMLEEVTCTKMAAGMVHHMEKKIGVYLGALVRQRLRSPYFHRWSEIGRFEKNRCEENYRRSCALHAHVEN